jgi:PleD family two-component response regulator
LSQKILAVDDEPDILRLTQFLLESWGYDVVTAPNGREALEVARAETPDLILMDVNMEEMNGFEACQHLKSDYMTSATPVIMLTSQDQIHNKVEGLGKGADDYVIKTVDPLELRARIEMVIRRTQEQSSANPLTKLPGNTAIERVVQAHLQAQKQFSVCYCDLDNFKAYNDKYGYEAGDRVIVHTAQLLMRAANEHGNKDDFVGHIGGDDYVVVTTLDKEDSICRAIVNGFDDTIPNFYDEEDRNRKFIQVENRSGTLERFPIMTITIAVVNNAVEQFPSSHVISERAAELKKYLKRFQGSNFLSERRGASATPNNAETTPARAPIPTARG